VKRGLITWDKAEIPTEIFEQRLRGIRRIMAEKDVPAAVVYSELWRSNPARYFSNYMPYFNRALLIIPANQPVTLLCGLSPRVYGWIRSVTTIEDVRPAGNFAKPLLELAAERGWTSIGILDFPQFPFDLNRSIQAGNLKTINLSDVPICDDTELAMRRKAIAMAREILETEINAGVGQTDYQFVGRLERRFRTAGAEDLVTLMTNGNGVPVPASGVRLEPNYSVSLALEYRGHWVRLTRPHRFSCWPEWLIAEDASANVENLSGSYPYECSSRSSLRPGSIFAVHVSRPAGAKQIFYGDTCRYGLEGRTELL
jgi:hypothetical protein